MLLYMSNADFHLAGDGKVCVYCYLHVHVLRVEWQMNRAVVWVGCVQLKSVTCH